MNKQHIIVLLFIIIVVMIIGLVFFGDDSPTNTNSDTAGTNNDTTETEVVTATSQVFFSGVPTSAFSDDFVMHSVDVSSGAISPVAPGTSLFDLEIVRGAESYSIANGVFGENVRSLGNLAFVDTDTFATSILDTERLIADVDATDEYLMTMTYTGVAYPEDATDLMLLSEWAVTVDDLTNGVTTELPFRFNPVALPNNNLLFYLSVDGVYAYDPQTETEFRVARAASPMTTNSTMTITPSGDLYLLNDQANTLTHYTINEFTDESQLVEHGAISAGDLDLLEVADTDTDTVVVSALNQDGVAALYTVSGTSLTELASLADFLPQTVQVHLVHAE